MKLARLSWPVRLLALVISMSSALTSSAAEKPGQSVSLTWGRLSNLPDALGVAGAFVGVSNGELLVAGGANFPDGPPWDGHPKVWHDEVYALDQPGGTWRLAGRLPQPRGYGVSASVGDALLCAGGSDAQGHSSDCFLLRLVGEKLSTEQLPQLPAPRAMAAAALLGDMLYVAGGLAAPDSVQAESTFWSLNLSSARPAWQVLESWPGPERMLAVAGVHEGRIYLFSGTQLSPDEQGKAVRHYLRDAYCFTPGTGWETLPDLPRAAAAAASPAFSIGPSHLILLGGDDGKLVSRSAELKAHHPGFSREVLAYHPLTRSWIELGHLPEFVAANPEAALSTPGDKTFESICESPVTTSTVIWRDQVVIPSGEVRPGVRSPQVLTARGAPRPRALTWRDLAVIVGYFLVVVFIGVYSGSDDQGTEGYFLGGRKIPWWAAGLSIFGGQLSAITFLTIPSKAFATNWVHLVGNFMVVAMAPLVVHFYLPFYRGLGVTSIYEFLEVRFNLAVRLVGATAFLLLQLGRLGIVLYLPALALSAATGLNIYGCILAMGLLTTLYTTLGGVEAVVWTDVMQVLVLVSGALAALAIMILGIPGGLSELFTSASAAGKFRVVHPGWSYAEPALWVIVIGRFLEQLVPYTADQGVAQRYLTTPTQAGAARSIWMNAALTIPTTFLFFFIGTALWGFYRAHPDRLDPTGKLDELFPWFIANELPPGLSGLLIAAVFAAAQSTLSASLNSMSAVITTDFFARLWPHSAEKSRWRVAWLSTLCLGLMGTAFALQMARSASTSMWDMNLRLVGLLGGGLAGIFAVGIFTRRPGAMATLTGYVVAVGCLAMTEVSGKISYLLFAGIGIVTCFVTACLLGLIWPGPRRPLPEKPVAA